MKIENKKKKIKTKTTIRFSDFIVSARVSKNKIYFSLRVFVQLGKNV